MTTSYIEELENTLKQIIAERDAALERVAIAEQRNQLLEKENRDLRARLLFYENPHTPPSIEKLTPKKQEQKSQPKHKRGAPKGHKGATRPIPTPDEIKVVIAKECEKCGSSHIEPLGDIVKTIIEDIPPPQKIKVTQYNRYKVRCVECGHEFISKHRDCPQIGNLGVYLMVYITMLKYHLRGVIRKIKDYLLFAHDFPISVTGVHDVLLRVGDTCEEEYNETVERIRKAPWVHIDETGMKVNGDKRWLWIFRSPQDDVLVVIRKSRGGKVVDEILGPDWNKPIVFDGWKAYSKYLIIQRCWAHLLREVNDAAKVSDIGKELSEEIHERFNMLKDFLDTNPSMNERERQKELLDHDMRELVEKYSSIEDLHKPVTYIRNGLGKWYTCLLYPGMEPTNNLGEQAIREHVIMRKIIGCFRSENGTKNYQYIASILASWKLQGKNIFVELEELLRNNLCLS